MMSIQSQEESIAAIRKFTGEISPQQLLYVDSFLSHHIAMFMPIAGPCMLAVSPMHKHPAHMFVLSFADATSIVLLSTTFRVKANTVSYIPPLIAHHEINDSSIPRYVAIMVSPEFLSEQSEAYKSYHLEMDAWKVFPSSDLLLSVVKRFIGECKNRKAGSDMILEALSVETVHILLRAMLGIKSGSSQQVSRIEINRSIEYMRQNLSEKLTLSSLACYSGMSVSNFTRIFRRETGLSPIDYLIEMRLDVACRLLLAGDLSVKQIACDCGFSSPSHFSSSFQKKYKIAPSGYMQPPSA